jgi:hypothetical protein
VKLTRQGVRDLDAERPRPAQSPYPYERLPGPKRRVGWCKHERLAECHPGCGHWSCPDCDFSWDDGYDNFPGGQSLRRYL